MHVLAACPVAGCAAFCQPAQVGIAEVRMDDPLGAIRAPVEATGSVLDLRPGL